MAGSLRIVATPIGNLDDLSPRALRALADADVIACEDTRVTRKLAVMAGARGTLLSYNAANERVRTPELVRRIAAGASIALVTDAGTPAISDPGQRLVAACRQAGVRVEVVPGPSAALAALVASGLPAARFVFEGFLPRTGGARRKRLTALASDPRTTVFFEAPHRIEESLEDILVVLGDRPAALARELTKVHEEVVTSTVGSLLDAVRENGARGEITLVVAGAPDVAEEAEPAELADRVRLLIGEGVPKKEAVARVAAEGRVAKRIVYQASVDAGL
ncbi:MAG: 16S rRNA (cytidine(1402)-2'-O)-methyltransferase [Actinomycetota bacterium]|nr:16S rRNA (cytidine(1402)-2'-O)-methyltransferase [Actinomycetota bacterium]